MDKYALMPKEKDEVRETLNNMLFEAGFDPSLLGYKYLIDACIFSIIYREKFDLEMVKGIYMEVAEKYDTTANRVERAIRHCIQKWWNYHNKYEDQLVSELKRCYNGSIPTNKQLVGCIIRHYF